MYTKITEMTDEQTIDNSEKKTQATRTKKIILYYPIKLN